ncbi:ABC transporter permease [Cytobacillus firmus]|nr:ABC transporter permease [Cytobacillus firmus]
MSSIFQIFKEQLLNINLICRLAFYDIKGKYLLHYLGVFWQFLNPAVQILIYWLVFGLGIRGGEPIGDVPFFVWLVCGLIPWFFINPSITQGANSVYSRLSLVSKMKFPVSILPAVTIVSNSFTFIIMLIVLLIILIMNGIYPSIYYVQIIYYLFCLYIFLYSFSLLFSTFSTIIRDIHSLLQTMMKMLFYLTPILWDTGRLPEYAQNILKLNPIYYLIEGFRNTLLFKIWFFEDLAYTFYFWSFTLFILFFGATIHLKFRKRFVDYL